MRNEVCQGLVSCAVDPKFVFLTGDLGFQALEPLQAVLGQRFINAGVAEQNMVSVAAGLAQTGLRPWVYSIAPFVYARPYEQIRNDICLHHLPVRLIGNGGGYGYGVMGGTHHALEDYGALLCLQHMTAFVPAFGSDLMPMIEKLTASSDPAYLRLGRSEEPQGWELPAYAPWRRLTRGGGATVVVVGPLAGSLLAPLAAMPEDSRPNLWIVTELPITPDTLPQDFRDDLRRSQSLWVIEEHVRQGGAGAMLAQAVLEMGDAPARYHWRGANGYLSGLYGSQAFHRRENGLDPETLLQEWSAPRTTTNGVAPSQSVGHALAAHEHRKEIL